MRGVYLIFLIGLLLSCDIFDKEEDIPGFIYVDSADLSTKTGQGSNSSSIIDITAYANNEFLGTFELPATIPVLTIGDIELVIAPGIKNNGMVSDRRMYPFYQFYRKTFTVIPDAVVPVAPDSNITFKYYNEGLYFYIEDFEETGYELIEAAGSNAILNQITTPPENVKDGYTLEVLLDSEHDHFEVRTDWGLTNLPKGNNMYLEIDFKGTVPLEVGIIAASPVVKKIFALGLVPQEDFTKVYIDLTEKISREVSTTHFEIYFEAQLPSTSESAELYIDNIKFIYP